VTVALAPISDADIPAVAAFLHRELNQRVSAQAWATAMTVPWHVDAPNHGFLVRDGDEIVGAYIAFYSQRRFGERVERFCNLGAWCVRPQYRLHSLRMLKAMLAQEEYTFTDLSPSGNVIPLNQRLKFQFLDTSTALVVNLPWPGWPGRVRLSADPAVIENTLTGDDLRIYRDHVGAAAAHHLLIRSGADTCYLIFRRDRRKRLPLFASLLYVSNPALLARSWRHVSRHLLLRHRIPLTLVELRVAGSRPGWATMLAAPRRKMFKSSTVSDAQIDYLYSELTCVAW
jgi:hypothetical protein